MEFCLLILYVADQERSTSFYKMLLQKDPTLHEPGMTEFELSPYTRLGLMPASGIARLICPVMPDPAAASGIPRCEVYLYVGDPQTYVEAAEQAGALLISPLQKRDWGDEAAYFADPDGHVLAFARKLASTNDRP